jgi:predicted ATPase
MEFQDRVMELTERLREVLPGFYAFKLEQAGRARILKVGFRGDDESGNVNFYEFEQLSDGQRVLIVLYSLLGGLNDPHAIMILDEPENYLALPEIQPWLMSLADHCDAASNQAILISHHPELIDYLGSEQGIWIEREAEKPARVQQLSSHPPETLKLSESIARGWPA